MTIPNRALLLGMTLGILLLGTVVVGATQAKPYAAVGCHFHDGADNLGTAYTDKCSCNPVDNYLAARVKIQCRKPNGDYVNFGWMSWATGTNVTTRFRRAASSGIGDVCTYIWGEHEAKCSGGSLVRLSSNKSR